ncbi:TetR/AcrR family transcriptional regulator [Vibrio harveyi]|uniref:TetR/AcrR family transcriptional regulator n=1 Tax=Vibrio harveyi TaxID=669 RepID=UPI001EFD9CD4|nr:TetR/AcrR family transcriptional regulator [Vibrio harveyi]MCG9235463.1 TetR/AcrR family transcriptional regulator [Vibrio harveyi]MCG9588256.1 TetR/AcrR family transcriptional regulator [Vibrio harveyi]CAH1226043.1 TetR/AcrR family transcriptional regulator [Vibrio harveyi]CAH1574567.1 TetR/AcrR family transcriptional regulator [Vibrio harveyi]CAH1583855.1 TetR/AcrR family transcriptional regulator [Vibrio harveyi]
MPKIVDHDKKRKEIALKATGIFLEFGYKNLGMRQLCEQLGMSKSAVYHYYKSKDELFKAATEAMVNFDAEILAGRPSATSASPEQQAENFVLIFQQMAPRFFQEMKLVSDYIDVIGQENVATDPCMLLANQKYMTMLENYVSAQHKESLYTLMLGLLNHQLMLGKALEEAFIIEQVDRILV